MGGIDLDGGGVEETDAGAHALDDVQLNHNVNDVGDILEPADAIDEDGGRDDGNGRILCAADIDLAIEGLAALDHNFLRHKIPPFFYMIAFAPLCGRPCKFQGVSQDV